KVIASPNRMPAWIAASFPKKNCRSFSREILPARNGKKIRAASSRGREAITTQVHGAKRSRDDPPSSSGLGIKRAGHLVRRNLVRIIQVPWTHSSCVVRSHQRFDLLHVGMSNTRVLELLEVV